MHSHKTNYIPVLTILALIAGSIFSASTAKAVGPTLINDQRIVATTGKEVQSGQGHLDLLLLVNAAGGGLISNEVSGAFNFNGDDANTQMPAGGTTSVIGSYITSMGEIRAFYRGNFPGVPDHLRLDEIAIFVDLSEPGGAGSDIVLNDLQVLIDYDDFIPSGDTRNSPSTEDITSAVQNSTGSSYAGGTVLAKLDPAPTTLPLIHPGLGWPDYYIKTGINPFDATYSDSTRILFFWNSKDHGDGGDKAFLSGEFQTFVPEPGTLSIVMIGGLLAAVRRRRRA